MHAGSRGGKIEPLVVLLLEAGDLGVFLGVGFHHRAAAQVLFDGGGQDGQLLLDLEGERAETGAKLEGRDQEGHGEQYENGQAKVHEEHRWRWR